MRPPVPQDRLVSDMIQIGRESQGYKDILSDFGEYLRVSLGTDGAVFKDATQQDKLLPVDEVVLNTGKLYVDNNLSGYSAFAELIGYYNRGFKCCAIIPLVNDGKGMGTITLLSTDDKGFEQSHISMINLASSIIVTYAAAKYEREKSLSVARYFDASFNNAFPQLLIDDGGIIVKASKSALNFLNASQKELAGINIGSIFAIGKEELKKLKEGHAIEVATGSQSGRTFWISPSRINSNLIHIIISDVSEFRDAATKAGMLDNAATETFMILDRELNIVWSSDNFENVFRTGKEILSGRKLYDFIVSQENAKGLLQRITEKRYAGQVILGFGNDTEFAVKLTAYKSGGEVYCILSRDYDKYVSSLERVSKDVVALANDPVLEINGSGYILAYNKAAETLLNLDKDIIGSPIYGMCADSESQNKIVASLPIARSNGFISDIYINMVERRERVTVPCVQTIKAMPIDESGAVRYLVMVKELATKKKFEELVDNLEKAQKEVEKLKTESDLKSQFIYNISHDLKTPITNIMGFSKILLTDYSDAMSKEQKDYIQIIYDESERFLQLVKQILDVAKLSSGIVKLDLQQVSFNDIKDNASINALAEACRNKNLTFTWTVDYDVPEITADPNRLIQIFSNLISNAIKFTEHGGITVKVTRKRNSVVVQVIDTGIGISKEDRTKIFKKFYQIRRDLVVQEGKGTGLGLSIVREIVHLHSGKMKVESEPGKGSTFSFTLPISARIKKKTMRYNT
jgi:signal transduction histidine kinase